MSRGAEARAGGDADSRASAGAGADSGSSAGAGVGTSAVADVGTDASASTTATGAVLRGALTSAGIVLTEAAPGVPAATDGHLATRIAALLAHRTTANAEFFAAEAERIARLCHQVAERFSHGGRIIACGLSAAARSDVRHVTVEFVHPVIVGKRALPAIGLTREAGPLPRQLELVAAPADIVIIFGAVADTAGTDGALEDSALSSDMVDNADSPGVVNRAGYRGLDNHATGNSLAENSELRELVSLARARGCLTIAFAPLGAEWEFDPPGDDPFIRQELIETLYHIVWELVHVFFEHRGLLEGRRDRVQHDAGVSAFLYPFLAEAEVDLGAVLDDVRRSALMKAEEVGVLRERTLHGAGAELIDAARILRDVFDAGGTLLVFGNGGSATDSMDAVADFRDPPGGWPPRRALDLTEDTAIITALANDIGVDSIFSRQIISHGQEGDAVLALSTSGNSRNIIQALAEARRRGLRTVALIGYDGGRILAERLADHVVTVPSQHIPRIQEAQASVYHILRELVELVG